MAKDKKSFVLYADLIGRVEHLTNEEKGVLFQHLLDYVNDLNPVLEDRILIGVWKPIEQQLKRDLKKFEQVKAKRSDAGKRSAELRALKKDKQNLTKSTSVESVKQTLTNPTVNDNVNVNVNDNVNEIKDKSFTINNKKFVLMVDNDKQFKETLAMQKKIGISWVNKKLPEFELHCTTTKKQHSNYRQFASHFNYWLNDNLPVKNEPPKPVF